MAPINSSKLSLQENDIHLWITQPQHIYQADLLTHYKSLLTATETQKQQRYRFEKDRHSALVTRAFVRDLLSHYADLSPADWCFEKGAYEKPEILNPPLPLRFNISHTNDMIICAVTLNDDIGCDVETITRNSDLLAIADSYFSASEAAELFRQPENQQSSCFFDYWTLKESYIKALGQGLAIPLADFSFHIGPADSTQHNGNIKLSFAPHRIDKPKNWRSWLFYPNNQHRIAISIKAESDNHARPYSIRYFESTPLVNTKELNCLCVGSSGPRAIQQPRTGQHQQDTHPTASP